MIAQLVEQRLEVVAARGLTPVVGLVVVNHDRGAEADEALGDGEPDPRAAADTGDQRDPPGQRCWAPGEEAGRHKGDCR